MNTTRTDLTELVKAAKARYDAMSPADKANHDHEQRRSFMRGLCPTKQDYNEWCEVVDRVLPPMRAV